MTQNDTKINNQNEKKNNDNSKINNENDNNNNNNNKTKEKDNKNSTDSTSKTNPKKSLKIEITSSTNKPTETVELTNSNNTKSFKRSTSLPPEIKNTETNKNTDSQKQIFNTILPSIPEKFDKTIIIKRNNSNSPNSKNISIKNKNKLLNKKQVNKQKHFFIRNF